MPGLHCTSSYRSSINSSTATTSRTIGRRCSASAGNSGLELVPVPPGRTQFAQTNNADQLPPKEETGRLTERFRRSGSGEASPAGRPILGPFPRLLAAGRLRLCLMHSMMSRCTMFRGLSLLDCGLGRSSGRRRGRGKDRSGDHHRRCEAETDKGANTCHNLHSIRSARRADRIMSASAARTGESQGMIPPWAWPF